jgi:hypothetical protein
MVMRIPVKDIKEKDIEKIIIDPYVRISISTTIAKRMAVGQSFKEAINGEFWMLDKEGNEIRYSKNGRKLCPIRHVRCRVKTGQGYMTYETSLQIKNQLYASSKSLINLADRSHKRKLYAQNNDNYLFLLYEGVKKGKVVRRSRIVNYYEIALLRQEKTTDGNYKINSIEDLLNEPYYNRIEEKGTIYNLSAVIKRKTRLIAWEQNPEELNELSIDELSKRLYVVVTFNSKGGDFLYLKSHINGTENYEISIGVIKDFKYIIEGRDFEIDDLGRIQFKD